MILAVVSQKGGVGKTTTAATLAQAAAYRGMRVLAVDLDPQGNLTFTLGGQATDQNCYTLLKGGSVKVQKTPQGIHLIPSALELSTLTEEPGSARLLQAALDGLRYDVIILDTPSKAGVLLYSALQAADRYILPVQADPYGVQSLQLGLYLTRSFRESNRKLRPAGVLVTMYSGRTNLARHMRQTIKEQAAALRIPYLGEIRPAVALQEAQGFQESLFEYAPKSKPAQDYLAVFDKLM